MKFWRAQLPLLVDVLILVAVFALLAVVARVVFHLGCGAFC